MLEKFLSVTHAITLPDLEEYNWRSNKVSDFDFVFCDFANMQIMTIIIVFPSHTVMTPQSVCMYPCILGKKTKV